MHEAGVGRRSPKRSPAVAAAPAACLATAVLAISAQKHTASTAAVHRGVLVCSYENNAAKEKNKKNLSQFVIRIVLNT